MAETWPRSSVRVFTDATGGGGPHGTGAAWEKCASSNTSPATREPYGESLGCGSEQLVS